METYCQSQGVPAYYNYNNNSCSGCQCKPIQNSQTLGKRHQVSVEQYNPNPQQINQSGQRPPEQPPMPPEAEAALSQLKNLPCPKKYFPPNMLNSNLPNAPQCGCNSGFSNSYSPSNAMFQKSGMQGDFTGASQNPHAANNAQLHAQNFQLHQELHGVGRSNQPYNMQAPQADFQNAMSNSQRQHVMNPQLHAQNMKMHQTLHGVGKPGNQGPQHSQALQSENNNSGRKFKFQPPTGQSQTAQSFPTNNNYQSTQNYGNQHSSMSEAQNNMTQQYTMGQQNIDQHHVMAQQSMSNNYNTAHHTTSPQINEVHMGQQSADPHSMSYHSMGQYSSGQHSVDPHSMSHQTIRSGHQNTMPQYSASNDYTGVHSHNHYQDTKNYNTTSSNGHYHNNSSTPYQTHTHESQNKPNYHMPQITPNHFHTHTEGTQPIGAVSSPNAAQNYVMHDMSPNTVDTQSVCRQDNSSQIQEILCPEPEPHFSVVQRSKGSHDLVKYNERSNINDGGEIYTIKPCIHHQEDSYPVQQNRIYSSMPNIQKMTSSGNQEKSNGLQGIRSSQAFSPKSWVIGPPAKKTRQDWMKHYT